MYKAFYGFTRIPFSATSEPHFFFESISHREAYAAMQYGIRGRKGIILITGEVGTGKTTLCKRFMDRLDPGVKASLVLNPYFSDMQLLQAVAEDFGITTEKRTRRDLIRGLNEFLIRVHAEGGNAVLLIDEAQHLSTRQLEQVRLLSNLETAEEKLLQLVLIGQPELVDKLTRHELRQIRQRIFVKYRLSPLKEDDVRSYLQVRLQDAGRDDFRISEACLRIIYEFSGGVPRLINMLCDRAFLMGYARDRAELDETIFRDAIGEVI